MQPARQGDHMRVVRLDAGETIPRGLRFGTPGIELDYLDIEERGAEAPAAAEQVLGGSDQSLRRQAGPDLFVHRRRRRVERVAMQGSVIVGGDALIGTLTHPE